MVIKRIVVLNDGETFSDLDGCKVVEIEMPNAVLMGKADPYYDETSFIESALQGEDGCMNILSVKKVVAGENVDLQS